jgi:hypothetical protein
MACFLSEPWIALLVPLALVLIVAPLGMISVNDEHILTFSQLAKRLPRRRRDRPTSPSTVHRWRSRGVRGVRLEAVRIGGTWVTSLEAYERFCHAVTANTGGKVQVSPTEEQERDSTDQVNQQLDELGISQR